jgi:hypothetical protein
VTTQKILVTEYRPQQYEATRITCKLEYKDEKYTAYKTEVVAEPKTRVVTYYEQVMKTREVQVVRYECVAVPEERTVVRNIVVCKPVKKTITRTVDVGGHYECREVPCGPPPSCGMRHGLFHRRHGGCGECAPACGPATTTVSVYVPHCVTETVEVTVPQNVIEQVTEKVTVVTHKLIEKKETVTVPYCDLVKKEREENYTVYSTKVTPYEAVRKVAYTVEVPEKVICTRLVAVQVEKEVTVQVPSTCGFDAGYGTDCGYAGGRHHGRLFHRHCR